MAPKARLQENKPLPKRWARKHGAIYYRVPEHELAYWENKSWFRLGKTLAEAHQTFSQRIYERGDRTVITMRDLLDRFEFEHLPTLKPATRKYYFYALPRVRQVFVTYPVPVARLQPSHAYAMMDAIQKNGHSAKVAKQAAECLSSALTFAVRTGVLAANPLLNGNFEKPGTEGRHRAVTDAELVAYAETLPRKWQLYIMLKLFTRGRRKGELLRIRRSHLTDEGIAFVNNKRTSDHYLVSWTPQLREIVTEILNLPPAQTGDAPLFATRDKKPYIDEDGQTSGFDSIWQRYMKKAVEAKICARFTEHDLRAKAVEHDTLEVASRHLRHTTTQVTQKHYRRKPERI